MFVEVVLLHLSCCSHSCCNILQLLTKLTYMKNVKHKIIQAIFTQFQQCLKIGLVMMIPESEKSLLQQLIKQLIEH